MARRTTTKATASVEAIAKRVPSASRDVTGNREQRTRLVSIIAERFDPLRISLFGSRAHGTPTGERDVDLMVIAETASHAREQVDATRASVAPWLPFRVDLHIRAPAQIRRGLREQDFFILDVMNGITLYEGKEEDLTSNDGSPRVSSSCQRSGCRWTDVGREGRR